MELNERLTTLGIAVNLVTYITGTMHLGNAIAANTVTNFMGTSFMLCLFGGFIADTYIGRFLKFTDPSALYLIICYSYKMLIVLPLCFQVSYDCYICCSSSFCKISFLRFCFLLIDCKSRSWPFYHIIKKNYN